MVRYGEGWPRRVAAAGYPARWATQSAQLPRRVNHSSRLAGTATTSEKACGVCRRHINPACADRGEEVGGERLTVRGRFVGARHIVLYHARLGDEAPYTARFEDKQIYIYIYIGKSCISSPLSSLPI